MSPFFFVCLISDKESSKDKENEEETVKIYRKKVKCNIVNIGYTCTCFVEKDDYGEKVINLS